MNVSGKIVLVTGASRGIGAAVAEAMAAAGAAEILLLARDATALEVIADRIRASGTAARIYPVDLSDKVDVAAVTQRIARDVGVPDVVVANAGAGQWKFLDETSLDEIEAMMAVPYLAAAWLIASLLPAMRRRGSGHIVVVSSIASRFVWPGATAYTAARWALRGLAEALRADLFGSGIGVTLFESGTVESPYWRHNPGSRERVPHIGRFVPVLRPQAVAAAIVDGVRHERHHVVAPLLMRIVVGLHRLCPPLVQELMTRTGFRPVSRRVIPEA